MLSPCCMFMTLSYDPVLWPCVMTQCCDCVCCCQEMRERQRREMEELQKQQRLEDERQREKQREELRRKKDLVRARFISSNWTIIGANKRVIIINSNSKKTPLNYVGLAICIMWNCHEFALRRFTCLVAPLWAFVFLVICGNHQTLHHVRTAYICWNCLT